MKYVKDIQTALDLCNIQYISVFRRNGNWYVGNKQKPYGKSDTLSGAFTAFFSIQIDDTNESTTKSSKKLS